MMFITFEGIDGSGKSTQIQLLKEWLERLDHTVTVLREPGGNVVSEQIRQLLLDSTEHIEPRCELLLFTAARAQLVSKVIRPALKAGHIVICDRYIDSSVAYQGYGRGLPIDDIVRINDFATAGLIPDITFIFDLTVDDAAKRAGFRSNDNKTKPDRMEQSGDAFFERTKQGYIELAQNANRNIFIIHAGDSMHDIRDQVETIVGRFL
ncbi:MAG: dTMP kinase [Candidatus Kapaibacteriota bacterium]|jgi:dTMP kinase